MAKTINEIAHGIGVVQLLSSTSVSLTSLGETLLYTVPSGKNLVVTSVVLFDPSSSLTAFIWSVGYNLAYDDVVGGQFTSGITSGDYLPFPPASPAIIGHPGDDLKIAVGSTHSGITVTVQVLGHLI